MTSRGDAHWPAWCRATLSGKRFELLAVRFSALPRIGHAAVTSNLDSFNLIRFMSVSSSEPASLYTAVQAGA
jgi:hypothetical protein